MVRRSLALLGLAACAKFAGEDAPSPTPPPLPPDGSVADAMPGAPLDGGDAGRDGATSMPFVCPSGRFCDGFERPDALNAPWVLGGTPGSVMLVTDTTGAYSEQRSLHSTLKSAANAGSVEHLTYRPDTPPIAPFEARFALRLDPLSSGRVDVVALDISTAAGVASTIAVGIDERELVLARFAPPPNATSRTKASMPLPVGWVDCVLVVSAQQAVLTVGKMELRVPLANPLMSPTLTMAHVGISDHTLIPTAYEAWVDNVVLPK